MFGKWHGDDRGTAAMEFALVFPLFMLVLVAIIDFGQYFAVRMAIVHAATEGARASVAGITEAERQSFASARVREVVGGYAPLVASDDHLSVTAATASAGLFRVDVAYTIPPEALISYGFNPLPAGPVSHSVLVSYGGY